MHRSMCKAQSIFNLFGRQKFPFCWRFGEDPMSFGWATIPWKNVTKNITDGQTTGQLPNLYKDFVQSTIYSSASKSLWAEKEELSPRWTETKIILPNDTSHVCTLINFSLPWPPIHAKWSEVSRSQMVLKTIAVLFKIMTLTWSIRQNLPRQLEWRTLRVAALGHSFWKQVNADSSTYGNFGTEEKELRRACIKYDDLWTTSDEIGQLWVSCQLELVQFLLGIVSLHLHCQPAASLYSLFSFV